MKDYKFTQDWFGSKDLEQFLPIDNQEEFHILEIGSFEGKSTVWFINNLLQNPNSTITCIDPWMNFIQNTSSFDTYSPDTKTQSGVDYIKDDIKGRFIYNVSQTGNPEKVKTIQGMSYEELPTLIHQKQEYDLIFIDGNHTAPFVLTDAIMSWYLLKKEGIMIFDDYLWGYNPGITVRPKLAVDSFISNFNDYCKVIWDSHRKAIIKL